MYLNKIHVYIVLNNIFSNNSLTFRKLWTVINPALKSHEI